MDKIDLDSVPVNRQYKTIVIDPSVTSDTERDSAFSAINEDGNWILRSATPFDAFGQGSIIYLFSKEDLDIS